MNVETSTDPTLLYGTWREALKNPSNQIELAPPNRGGRRSIEFTEKEISWNGPLNCGFGSRKLGTWTLAEEKLSIVFSREQGYANRQKDNGIEEKLTFVVELLNSNELALVDGEGTKFYFVK